ncbi:hypothetical protein MMPV_002270 [Pyropia vietnamensis]
MWFDNQFSRSILCAMLIGVTIVAIFYIARARRRRLRSVAFAVHPASAPVGVGMYGGAPPDVAGAAWLTPPLPTASGTAAAAAGTRLYVSRPGETGGSPLHAPWGNAPAAGAGGPLTGRMWLFNAPPAGEGGGGGKFLARPPASAAAAADTVGDGSPTGGTTEAASPTAAMGGTTTADAGTGTAVDADAECGDACAVCLFEPEDGESVRRLPCSHLYHAHCIEAWAGRNNRCPVCNAAIEPLPTDGADAASPAGASTSARYHRPSGGTLLFANPPAGPWAPPQLYYVEPRLPAGGPPPPPGLAAAFSMPGRYVSHHA